MYDQLLNIRTMSERAWPPPYQSTFHRLESISYKALDQLKGYLSFEEEDHFVDFGCGTGRAIFYMNHFHSVEVTGIELHPITFSELEDNEVKYKLAYPRSKPVHLIHDDAANCPILPEYTTFYFFNPFNLTIFKEVIEQIVESLQDYPRQGELILYYPLPQIQSYIELYTPFRKRLDELFEENIDTYDRFIIYSYPN